MVRPEVTNSSAVTFFRPITGVVMSLQVQEVPSARAEGVRLIAAYLDAGTIWTTCPFMVRVAVLV